MTKLKAALIHLLISVFIVGSLSLLIVYIWYPKPFFTISGVSMPLKLLIFVDVIIGPLLTFVVYKKNKKSLKFDLSVIAIMQLAALIYGANTIYQGRPSLLVMNNGKLNYLVEKFAKNDELKNKELKPTIFSQPKIAYLSNLTNLDIYSSYADIEPITDESLMLMPFSLSIDNMKAKFSKKKEAIDKIISKYQGQEVVFFELVKDSMTYYVAFSKTQNKIVEYLKF
jgi:hypothetical protein